MSRVAQPRQGILLELAYPLPRQTELLPHFLQRVWGISFQSVPTDDYPTKTLGEPSH
jgi:hypothetical protein